MINNFNIGDKIIVSDELIDKIEHHHTQLVRNLKGIIVGRHDVDRFKVEWENGFKSKDIHFENIIKDDYNDNYKSIMSNLERLEKKLI